MNALDIITLEDAKNNLRVDFNDDDSIITRIIKTSVDWVERYTCYRLFERTVEVVSDGCVIYIHEYPVTVLSVEKDENPVNYTTQIRSDKLSVYVSLDSVVTLSVGYSELSDVPSPLLDACYKLITYLYENRDAYSLGIPVDIQGLINQYRRGLF